jgi:hypothetical protein
LGQPQAEIWFIPRTHPSNRDDGKRIMRSLFALLLLSLLGGPPQTANAQDAPLAGLAGFEPFIGEWSLDGSVNTFEWGPGRSSVVGRSYRVQAGERVLVSHGIWYWHPEKQAIEGKVTATGMPVTLFEYTTRFVNGDMVSDLATFGPDGEPGRFVETMKLIDEDRYEWRLLFPRPDTTEIVMQGIFKRR